MTRDEYRRQSLATRRGSLRIREWLMIGISLPILFPMFLGDILAAPFTARRHESGFRWGLFMFARFAAPITVIVLCIGYII